MQCSGRKIFILLTLFVKNCLCFAISHTPPTSLAGASYEAHETFSSTFLVVNQYFPNHFFYELRANLIQSYVTLSLSSFVNTEGLPPARGEMLTGVGGTGIFGYVFDINQRVSIMPYIRLQDLPNTYAGYKDNQGNEIKSHNYTAFLGGKLLLGVNESFDIYAQYFLGYQHSLFSGKGIFATTTNPTLNAWVSIMEIDFPYYITNTIRIMPYFQYISLFANPDSITRNKPYNFPNFTYTSVVCALRLEHKW